MLPKRQKEREMLSFFMMGFLYAKWRAEFYELLAQLTQEVEELLEEQIQEGRRICGFQKFLDEGPVGLEVTRTRVRDIRKPLDIGNAYRYSAKVRGGGIIPKKKEIAYGAQCKGVCTLVLLHELGHIGEYINRQEWAYFTFEPSAEEVERRANDWVRQRITNPEMLRVWNAASFLQEGASDRGLGL